MAPDVVFHGLLAALAEGQQVKKTRSLEPFHDDHLAVVARPD